jgi:copper transport protein
VVGWAGGAAVATGLALIDGSVSHTVPGWPAGPAVAATALHLLAMSLWIGGLIALLALWRVPALDGQQRQMLRRFGRLAGAAVALLIGSGVMLAAGHLGSVAAWTGTPYGQVLIAKLCCVGAALALAIRSVRHAATPRSSRWRSELTVLIGVLALAATLLTLAPPN